MWVVLRVQKFEVEPQRFFKVPISIVVDSSPMIGYLPVYRSRKDALQDFPIGPLREIKEIHE